MNYNELEITNGYVSVLGKTYHAPTEQEYEEVINKAAKFNNKNRDEIIQMIESGKSVKWCQSPNYFYDHSYGTVQKKQPEIKIEMVECDCGHSVPRGSVMNASMGTSCPDCYDRMSM